MMATLPDQGIVDDIVPQMLDNLYPSSCVLSCCLVRLQIGCALSLRGEADIA